MANEAKVNISSTSSVIDIALAMAAAWPEGLDAVSDVFATAARDSDDTQLFAAIAYLSSRFPEADEDRQSWNGIVRNRKGLGASIRTLAATTKVEAERKADRDAQGNLFQLEESELSR